MIFQKYTWIEYCSEVSGILAHEQGGRACLHSIGMRNFS